MQPYSYKDSGIEWLGEIPKHWKVDRIKDVSQLREDKVKVNSEERNYLELEDMEQGTGQIVSFRDTTEVVSAVMKFRKGDVLFGKLRPYLAKYYYALEDGLCTGEILAIEPIRLDGKYLKYFIGGPNFIEQCTVNSYGAKMPRVNWNTQIGTFSIPLPPLREQEAIAAYLEKTCARIDRILAIKEEQLKKIEEHLEMKISQYVTIGISETNATKTTNYPWIHKVNATWSISPLKRALAEKLKYGANESAEDEIKEHPRYIRITDFDKSGSLKADTFKSLPPEVAEPYMLQDGDVLFARSGATVGKTFIFTGYDGQACFAGYLIKANTLRYKLLPEFLYYFTKSRSYSEWKNLIFTQATIQNIGADKYQYLQLPLPPVSEQEEIIRVIKDIESKTNLLAQNLDKQIITLKAYRKSLIHECVTGKKQIAEMVKEKEESDLHG